ncbi:MAG: hypothetical protein PHQ03_01320 [Methylococcales bacterium]|nr:hypothetical protein [Methylococcales bacterium]
MKKITTPFAVVMGTALISSVATVNAETTNPFGSTELSSGYMQLAAADTESGVSMRMNKPSKTAEGKCGDMMDGDKMKKGIESACGAMMKGKEGACGGLSKGKMQEGSCGAVKANSNDEKPLDDSPLYDVHPTKK